MAVAPAFPYEAVAVKKYKSPHKNDLSFAKGDTVRVVSLAPKDDDDDEDEDEDEDQWLVGETLDGSKTGTFPASHVEAAAASEEQEPKTAVPAIPSDEAAPDPAPSAAELRTPAEAVDTASKADISSHADAKSEASVPPAPKEVQSAAKPIAVPSATDSKEALADDVSAKPTPARKPSSPPLAPKPSGLAARIAAFNKPQEAPPPLPRGKPGGWKPPPPAPGAPKPILPGPSAAQLSRSSAPRPSPGAASAASGPTSPSTDAPSEATDDALTSSRTNAGFSAADAQSSIKMSLKERMAALQRNEASAAAAPREGGAKPATTPKPAPGKISEDRRGAAQASIGTADQEPAKVPANADETEEADEPKASPLSADEDETRLTSAGTAETDEDQLKLADDTDAADAPEQVAEEEKTEEEVEADRRAAIAKRMAALGGRRMGTGPGPAMFGAPAPAPKPRQLSTDDRPVAVEEASAEAPVTPRATGSNDAEGVERPTAPSKAEQATLAVPRRAAPPRRKKGSASSQPTSEPARQESQEDAGPALTEEGSSTTTNAAVGAAGVAAGAGVAAAVLSRGEEDRMTEEPESTIAHDTNKQIAAPVVMEPENQEREALDVDDAADDDIDDKRPSTARRPTHDSLASGVTDKTLNSAASVHEAEDFEPVSPSILEEHARQLEAFVRTPEDDFTLSEATQGSELNAASRKSSVDPTGAAASAAAGAAGAAALPTTVDRSSVSSPPPPSNAPPRPPSTRPPIPKASLPTAASETSAALDRTTSPAPTRAPPVPRSATGTGPRRSSLAPSSGAFADDAKGDDAGAADEQEEETVGTTPTILAAPRPRMALPTESSDDEDEQNEPVLAQAPPPAAPASAAEEAGEELDEEDQDRLRRRRLAERMAKMGGQPIMGAPMPMRKRTEPAPEEEEEEAEEEEDVQSDLVETKKPSRAVSREASGVIDEEGPDGEDEEADQIDDDQSSRRKSIVNPPPIPTSAPPIPTKTPPPPSRSSDAAKRSSRSFADSGSELARSSSGVRSRPPVPSVTHSRQGTQDDDNSSSAGPAMANEEQLPFVSSPPARVLSPPALPSSPPPRAPPRAPPPARQGSASMADDAGSGTFRAAGLPRDQHIDQQARPASHAAVTEPANLKGVQPSAPSSRDLDLMPSSQWWRHGRPVKLPPTLLRPDAVRAVSVQDEGATHLIRIDVIFEDYSSTTITVLYRDDDAAEEATEIAQRHNFQPPRPSAQELQSWSQQYGARIARQAAALLGGGKGGIGSVAIGDGTSRGFLATLIEMTCGEECLPPVGSSFGAILLAQAATTPVDQGADEIRAGDIVALHGADLKGKRGLTSYHVTFGTANDPAYACVIESTAESSKKRKLRCVLVPSGGASSGKGSKSAGAGGGAGGGAPEEVSLRLDDVKSGLLRVFRVAPRQGWLPA